MVGTMTPIYQEHVQLQESCPASDVGDTVNLCSSNQLSDRLHIDPSRFQQLLANTPLQQWRSILQIVFLEQDLPCKAEHIRMNPRASNTNKTITRDNSIPNNQLLLIAYSSRKTDKIKTAILGKQLGHDCGFSPDNRHSRLLRTFR